MSRFKTWPHLVILAAVCALLGWGAAALLLKNEPKAEALAVPRAARVERVNGEAGLYRGLATVQPDAQADERWEELTPNAPVTVGDRIYVRDNSEASVAFTGRNFARLDPGTAVDVLSLSDERTQLALRDGSAVFNLGALRPGELYEVATPRGAFELREPGFYEVGLNDDGSAWVSVLSGLAQVVGLAGSGQIGKGEMLTLLGQTAAGVALSRLSPDYAGGLLDDYYGYQYPDTYDGRYRDYNAYLNDPYYYDPYNRYESYRHVSDHVPGVYDLDRHGQWQDVSGYGTLWRPSVGDGWAPYRDGYWTVDDPFGLTWVSNEPWGYAPYHYGRWANVNNQWYWVPEGANTAPAYSPALVAFMPLDGANQIAWVPLAPGEQYATPYYDANWQPHYYGDGYAAPQQVVNYGVPNAVTVVPAEYFHQHINDGVIVAADPRLFGESRPVLDPFSVAALRQAALATTNTRRRVSVPPGIAKKLDETYVYTSARPFAPPFLEGRTRGGRAEVVPEWQKKQKLQFRDERRAGGARRPAKRRPDIARRSDELRPRGAGRDLTKAGEARQDQSRGETFESNRGRDGQAESNPGRGRGEERRAAREIERQHRAAEDAARAQGRAAVATRAEQQNALRRAERQRAQGARVAMPQQPKHAQRQQAQPAPRQQRHNAAPQAARQQRTSQGPPQQVMRQQQKAERKQGPPAHAGGGGKGKQQAPQQQGKGKGKGRP